MSNHSSQSTHDTATQKAINDVKASLANSSLWLSLAWTDIVQRYRGSLLGPFWLTLSTAALIAGLGPIYSVLFGLELRDYLPYLASGLLVWNFISSTINDSCRTFIDAGPVMKQIKMPLSNHLFHLVTRNIIIFMHGAPLYALIVIFLGLPVSWTMLWAIPGFILLCAILLMIGLVLAIVSVRFRDFIQVVASVVQISFFITPIVWHPGDRPSLVFFSDLNPFASMIALVRNPILGQPLSAVQLGVNLGGFVVCTALASALFVRYRARIVYWI